MKVFSNFKTLDKSSSSQLLSKGQSQSWGTRNRLQLIYKYQSSSLYYWPELTGVIVKYYKMTSENRQWLHKEITIK